MLGRHGECEQAEILGSRLRVMISRKLEVWGGTGNKEEVILLGAQKV